MKKLAPKLDSTNNLDLAKKSSITVFLDFVPPTLLLAIFTLSIVLLSPMDTRSLAKDSTLMVFSIKVDRAAIWLRP